MSSIRALSSAAVEVMGQLFIGGPAWDGNVVSKSGRDDLVEMGFAERWNGWQWLTREGIEVAVTSDIGKRNDRWRKKASGL